MAQNHILYSSWTLLYNLVMKPTTVEPSVLSRLRVIVKRNVTS